MKTLSNIFNIIDFKKLQTRKTHYLIRARNLWNRQPTLQKLFPSPEESLYDYFFQFDGYLWKESFAYVEHISKGPQLEIANAKWHFRNVLKTNCLRNNFLSLKPNSFSAHDGKCLWVTEYELASEYHKRTGVTPDLYPQYSIA